MHLVMAVLIACSALAACDAQPTAESVPPPETSNRDHVGYYCSMIVADHTGPKGQIHLSGRSDAHWFTSARDTLAFLRLPDEPKNVAAAYVTDMTQADWANPELQDDIWIDARTAWYVIGSRQRGGMGQAEAVPFASQAAAVGFADVHGGQALPYAEVPDPYLLASEQVRARRVRPMPPGPPIGHVRPAVRQSGNSHLLQPRTVDLRFGS